MHPLLLAALAVGGVVIVRKVFGAGAASDRYANVDRTRFDGTSESRLGKLDRLTRPTSAEKFMDPLYEVYGDSKYRAVNTRPVGLSLVLNRNYLGENGTFRKNSMRDDGAGIEIGYEYLASVSNNASARVAAMRQKIVSRGATPPQERPIGENDGTLLGNLANASRASLRSMASSMFRSYQQIATKTEAAQNVANKLGVSVDTLKSEAIGALSSAKSGAEASQEYAVLDKAIRDYGPVAKTAINAVARAIEIGRGSEGDSTGSTLNEYLDIAGDVALMIPVYGWIVGAALKGIGAIAAFIDPSKDCNEERDVIKRNLEAASRAKMPIPWQMFNVFTDTCESGATTEGMRGLQLASLKNEFYFRSMPSARQIHVARWWATASTFASHPKVFEVFAALGIDASGGLVASDEQVMLVAAPIAVMYGYDVDELAIELHKRAPGWRAAAEAFAKPIDHDQRIRNFLTDDFFRQQPSVVNEGVTWEWRTVCSFIEFKSYCEMPANVWWLQWSILAEQAFLIVEEWQATRVRTIAPLKFDLSKLRIA